MSHFAVLVVGDDWEEQLAPFQENNMGDCPNDYLEFNDCTEKVKEGFSNKDDKYVKEYKTIEEYAEGYHRYSVHEGKFGYWENPDAKWDWYMMGGRWAGYFKLLPGAEGMRGRNGVGESCNTKDSGWVDQARIKDIDFDAMRSAAEEKASKKYKAVQEVFGGEIPKLEVTWPDMLKREDIDIDEKRKLYHKQPAVKRMEEVKKKYWDQRDHPAHDMLVWGDLEDFQCTHDEYVERKGDQAIPTFAVVKDGNWYEKGKMGWWACVSDEKEERVWGKEFAKLLSDLSGDTLLTVIDCHI